MKRTTTSLISASMLFAGLTVQSAPFLAIGDSAELFLTGSVGVRFDDNVLMSANKVNDTVFEVVPGLLLEFGKGSQVTGIASYAATITRYNDNGSLDDELSALRFRSNFDNGTTKFGLNFSFEELNQNTVDTAAANTNRGTLSPREVTTAGANVEFGISGKSKLGIGLTYLNTDYKLATFTDSKITTVPITYFLELTPKVDGQFGFQYRDTSLSGNALDSKDYFYFVGARGEFTPKLNGSLRVGYSQRTRTGLSSVSTIGIDSSLVYAYSEKTRFNISLSNDYGNSGVGDSQRNLSFGLGLESAVSPELTLNAGLNYRNIDYFNRGADDYTEFNLGGTYQFNRHFSVNASLVHRINESPLPTADFDNTVLAFTARLRY
jgi:polysaccharide biosynthesis protein VpsM